jgi:uncharacterized protein (TIGR01370 family)
MRKACGFSLIIISFLSFACRHTPATKQINPRLAVSGIERFGVQFSGEYNLADMAPYQMMILDPDQAGAGDADSISTRGTIAIAYLNIGEAEVYRWFYKDIHQDWILAPNPNWKDHFYIDVNNKGWHKLVMNKIIPSIFEKGFSGLFLDMADVASPSLYPMLEPGVVSLIREMREEYPDKVIIMNDGTFLAGAVSDAIDGIVVESVFTTYDFITRSYIPVKEENSAARCSELQQLKKATGVKIFAIDYAPPGDTITAQAAAGQSTSQGFVPFVSTIELNTLPKPLH